MHTRALTIVSILFLASSAHADKADKEAKKAAKEAAKAAAKAAKKEKKENKGKFIFGGRVFGRSAFVKPEGDSADLENSIVSARLKGDYRWRDVLRAEIEVEFRSTAKLKNAFVKLKAGENDAARVDVRAGNFKLPFDAISLSSSWTLPMADRGMLDNVMTNRLQISGRHLGGDVELKLRNAPKLEIDAGVFEGTDDFGNPLDATWNNVYGQDAALRAELEATDGVTIGAAAEERSGTLKADFPAKIRHRWASDVDLTVDRDGLRVWAEAFAGSTWVVQRVDKHHTDSIFAGARTIAAYRFGGRDRGACFFEPYASVGTIDPDSSYGNDLVTEAVTGIGYGDWDVWRVQLEGQMWRFGKNTPDNVANVQIPNQNQTALLVQVGAHL